MFKHYLTKISSFKLSRHLARPLQLAVSLVLLNVSVLFIADFLDLREDPRASIHDARKALSVTLVERLSILASNGDRNAVEEAVADFASRGADTVAVALVLADGNIPIRRGDMSLLEEVPGSVNGTRVNLPVLRNNEPWGEVRIAFKAYHSAVGELDWLIFVALGSLFSFTVFFIKVLVQLDPGKAVPERVDSAFDVFSAGVLILDEQQRIIMANSAASVMLGRPSNSITGLSLKETLTFEVDASWQAPWETTLHSGLVVTDQQLRLRGNDEESRLYSVSCMPVGDENSGRRGVLVTLDDMTMIERKNAELATTLQELSRSRNEIESRNVQLERLATTDSMTGVANRRTFFDKLAVAVENARTRNLPLCCVMVDIDHFKQVNDNHGHPAGDAVIIAVANVLSMACRKQDMVSRVGGEEFVLLLPGLDVDEAFEVADRVRIAVIALAYGEELPVSSLSASFGVAALSDDMTEIVGIVDAADRALYVSKETGRNRVSVYSNRAAEIPAVTPESIEPDANDQARAHARELETRLKAREQEILTMRDYDMLTGAPLRMLFLQCIASELTRAQRNGTLVGVLCFELRDHARVVSAVGHAKSDALVVAFVERLQEGLRSSDLVSSLTSAHSLSRITSNEFGVLLSDLNDSGGALIVVARLRRLLSQPFNLGQDKIYLGANIGIALSHGEDETDAALFFEHASQARREASGKPDKVSHAFASAVLDDKSHDYIRLESDLRDALEDGALEAYFQPKFDIDQRRVTGMETLVRWNHPTQGFISPEVFVAIAEANGLIDQLSDLVLERTVEQILVWRSMGFTDLRVSINVSPVQLKAELVIDATLDALARSGVSGKQLEIELTETSILDCTSEAREALQRLREAGVHIAIDDFGTGYTSLSLLADLPLDTVKIDRSFIIAMAGGERNRAVVESIIKMAHALELRVVGEGIETNEQLEMMARLGCDEIQGYLISHPLPADEITAFLVHQRAEPNQRRA